MEKSEIIARFKAQNSPRSTKSKLSDFKQEIFSMSDDGYTQEQIVTLLKELGVSTKQSNLSRWMKRQKASKEVEAPSIKAQPAKDERPISTAIIIEPLVQNTQTKTKSKSKKESKEQSLF